MKKILFLCITFCLLFLIQSCGKNSSSSDGTDDTTTVTDGLEENDHRIFVSSTTTTGVLTSLSDADASCQTLASNAGLTRTYKAILSDSTDNAIARISGTGAVYAFTDSSTKVKIVDSLTELWQTSSADLQNGVTHDEGFVSRSGDNQWTGSLNDGTASFSHCSNWTSTALTSGAYGQVGRVSTSFLNAGTISCSTSTLRLLCISQ